MKRILITGGLGHIGSRLLRVLPQYIENAEFIIYDNLLTQRYCSLFHLPKEVKYTFINGDILSNNLLEDFYNIDVVVHLAAITQATESIYQPEVVEKVNYEGTVRVVDACHQLHIPIFFPSSTSVYGSKDSVVDETTKVDLINAQTPYAETKVAAEQYLEKVGKEGLRYTVIRFGTIFGISPGIRFHTAVNKFTWQACVGEPITVWETALHQRRPYLDIEDAVKTVSYILKNDIFDNQIYNLVTLNATVEDIINEIQKHIPDLNISFIKSEAMNTLSYDVNCDKICKIGVTITGSLERGVRDTVQMFNGLLI